MLLRGMYAVAVLLLGAALSVAQTPDANHDVLAVGHPREQPPPKSALPPLPEASPIKPVSFQAESPPPPAPPLPQGSLLSIEAVGPESIAPDQPLAYEIIVRNAGSIVLGCVRVEDVLPPGAKLRSTEPKAEVQNDRLAWNLGNLDPGVERRLKVEIQPGASGEVTVTPTATFTLTKPCRTRIVRPPFAVTQTVVETAPRGSPVTFQIHVANYSEQTINNIVLHDELPPGLVHPKSDKIVCDIPTLAPGEMQTINLVAQAVQSGRLTNHASAIAPGGWQADSRASVLVMETPLTVRLVAPKQTLVGQEFDFHLEVSNPCTSAAANVRVLQMLPDGVDMVMASTGGTLDAPRRTVIWQLGTLPPGQTQMLALKLRTKTAGDWSFKTSATADGTPETTAVHTLHIEGGPSLGLEIVRHDDAIDLGAESVYEIRVLNQGTIAAQNLHLIATVSPELFVLKAEGPTTVDVQPKQIVFTALPQLPGRSDAVYRIRVKGQSAGNGTLTVQATTDQLTKPLVQQVNTRVLAR